MTKDTYTAFTWAGLGIGAIVWFFSFGPMVEEWSAPGFVVGLVLVIFGLYCLSRVRGWEAEKERRRRNTQE